MTGQHACMLEENFFSLLPSFDHVDFTVCMEASTHACTIWCDVFVIVLALSPLLVESIALDFDPLKNYLPVAHDGNKKGHSWPSLGRRAGTGGIYL
jgi:hypothetical protein